MPVTHSQHRLRSGNATVPALMITAALLASGLLFYFFTFKGGDEPAPIGPPPTANAPAPKPVPQVDPAPVAEVPEQEPSPEVTAVPEPPTPAPVVQTPFRQPEPLAESLRDAIAAADAEKLAALLGVPPDNDAATAPLREWLDQMHAQGWSFDPLELVGRHSGGTRFRLPLSKLDPDTGERLTDSIELNLRRQPDLTWKLDELALTPSLADGPLAERLGGVMAGIAGDETIDPEAGDGAAAPLVRVAAAQPDALEIARNFLHNLLTQDYEAARQLVAADRVPAERLAGLCIVFEEGKYQAVPGQLVATAVDGDNAWVVAQVRSGDAAVNTELGIELERIETQEGESAWMVSGLNLSQLLSRYTSPSGGVPYVPIVEHPAGGESLVLFFDFDDADLHERAQRQLDIVARLLKADETKTIRISGHTDARGTEDYNQRLSMDRAERVRKELLALGVPVAQIITEAFGPERPLSPNVTPDGEDNPLGRARNRRAEIYLDF